MAVSPGHLSHLVRRFVGSLWPGGPPDRDERWVRAYLLAGEIRLWERMSGPDRRHAVGVARRAIADLATIDVDMTASPGAVDGSTSPPSGRAGAGATPAPAGPGRLGGRRPDRAIVAAALLHDVGKVESGFGPVRRALATVVALAVGHEGARGWRGRPGTRGRVGTYLCHDAIGAELLATAGSDDLTVRWAREHHLPPDRWTIPPAVGTALKAADDD